MRIRITFSKADALRYTGHLDLFRSWERTFRRSGLPLVYSQGFHPQPHLNLACALPLGFTSECEMVDAWLECELSIQGIRQSIEAALPPGLMIHGLEVIDNQSPALQTQVISAVYLITFLDPIPDLEHRIHRVMIADHLPRIRRGKSYDLRPLIEEFALNDTDEQGLPRIRIQLSARESATGRPEELLAEMGVNFETTRVHREKLILKS